MECENEEKMEEESKEPFFPVSQPIDIVPSSYTEALSKENRITFTNPNEWRIDRPRPSTFRFSLPEVMLIPVEDSLFLLTQCILPTEHYQVVWEQGDHSLEECVHWLQGEGRLQGCVAIEHVPQMKRVEGGWEDLGRRCYYEMSRLVGNIQYFAKDEEKRREYQMDCIVDEQSETDWKIQCSFCHRFLQFVQFPFCFPRLYHEMLQWASVRKDYDSQLNLMEGVEPDLPRCCKMKKCVPFSTMRNSIVIVRAPDQNPSLCVYRCILLHELLDRLLTAKSWEFCLDKVVRQCWECLRTFYYALEFAQTFRLNYPPLSKNYTDP